MDVSPKESTALMNFKILFEYIIAILNIDFFSIMNGYYKKNILNARNQKIIFFYIV